MRTSETNMKTKRENTEEDAWRVTCYPIMRLFLFGFPSMRESEAAISNIPKGRNYFPRKAFHR